MLFGVFTRSQSYAMARGGNNRGRGSLKSPISSWIISTIVLSQSWVRCMIPIDVGDCNRKDKTCSLGARFASYGILYAHNRSSLRPVTGTTKKYVTMLA